MLKRSPTYQGAASRPLRPERLNWNDLRYVLALAREGNVQAAARALGVNETTVMRRIAAIEAELGVALFERVERGQFPQTKPGEVLVAHAARIEQRVFDMRSEIAGRDGLVCGSVRLTSVPILVNHILTPRSADLLVKHADLRLEIVSDFRNLDLMKREAEVALRLGGPNKRTGDSLLSRRVGRLEYAEYAPAGSTDANLPWLSYDTMMAFIPQARWIADRAADEGGSIAPIALNDAEGILQAVAHGLGRSILPCAVADSDPRLRRVGKALHEREVWVLTHPEHRALARVGVVLDWLADIFRRLTPA